MCVTANPKKIILTCLFRFLILLLILGLVLLAGSSAKPNEFFPISFIIIACILWIYVLLPLRHINEKLLLCENKIVFGKKEYVFIEPTEIKWFLSRPGLCGRRLLCYKDEKHNMFLEIFFPFLYQMDVTYLDKPHEAFIQHYFKTVN